MKDLPVLREGAPAVVRPPCPFYGFIQFNGSLMDTHGNTCALLSSESNKACRMEMLNMHPDWKKCYFFNTYGNRRAMREVLTHMRIYPHELRPEGEESWRGIELEDWFRHVMGEDYIPPDPPTPAA